jgi:hypothetical protein
VGTGFPQKMREIKNRASFLPQDIVATIARPRDLLAAWNEN